MCVCVCVCVYVYNIVYIHNMNNYTIYKLRVLITGELIKLY